MIKEFLKPESVEEALKLKSEHKDYRFIAGGTEINAKGYPGTSKVQNITGLISLCKLGLSQIVKEDKKLIIYPGATLQEIIDNPLMQVPPFDMIKKAASNVSNRNVRNMATAGGNIGACKSCSDLIPILMVMDGTVEIHTGINEKSEIPVSDYIEKEEKPLITKITVPSRENFHISICRYTRASNDLALINICLGLELTDGICKDARLVIGGVAASPVRIKETEKFLTGMKLKGKLNDYAPKLREHVEKHINPIDDLRGKGWFKKELAGGLVIEALFETARKGGITL